MPRRTVYSDTSAHRVVLPWAQARALTLTPVLPTTTSRQSSSHGEFLAHPTLLHANGKTSYCPRRFIVLEAILAVVDFLVIEGTKAQPPDLREPIQSYKPVRHLIQRIQADTATLSTKAARALSHNSQGAPLSVVCLCVAGPKFHFFGNDHPFILFCIQLACPIQLTELKYCKQFRWAYWRRAI